MKWKIAKSLTLITALITALILLVSCGFHLRGNIILSEPLKVIYIKTIEPYDSLTQNLKDYLKRSGVQVTDSPEMASTILDILAVESRQDLLSVSSTQQTLQYNLILNVHYQVTDRDGKIIVPPQVSTETRVLTIESNQILGSSNEADVLDKQMRKSIVLDIMNRLASPDITQLLTQAKLPL